MLRRLGSSVAQCASAQCRQLSSGAGGAGGSGSAGAGGAAGLNAAAQAAAAAAPKGPPPLPKIKGPEQLTPEELERALPSMFFTTSNLVWSTLVASAVAAAGLVSMVWLGTWIVNAADSMRVPAPAPAAPPPPPPKPLAQIIAERKAELEEELQQLQQLPRTSDVKQRLSEVRQELRSFRAPGAWWWPF